MIVMSKTLQMPWARRFWENIALVSLDVIRKVFVPKCKELYICTYLFSITPYFLGVLIRVENKLRQNQHTELANWHLWFLELLGSALKLHIYIYLNRLIE